MGRSADISPISNCLQVTSRLITELRSFGTSIWGAIGSRPWVGLKSSKIKETLVSMPGEDEEESQKDKHHSEVEGRQRSLSLAWIRLLVIGWQGSLQQLNFHSIAGYLTTRGAIGQCPIIHCSLFPYFRDINYFSQIQVHDATSAIYPKTFFLILTQLDRYLSKSPIAYINLHQQGIKMAYRLWV